MPEQRRKLRPFRAQRLSIVLCLVMQPFIALVGMSDAQCAEEESENLLSNAGFESGTNGQPDIWRYFVAPADGAEALWNEVIHRSGKRSAMLHIETPYAEEVYNNWYQHVKVTPVPQQLNLSGYIRSKDVTDAALWLQCWRESSPEVLRFATTSVGHPVNGTVDWTRVETSIVPPPETSFLTVRCIIGGKGSAWFDDLQLVAEKERDTIPPAQTTDDRAKKVDQDAFKELLEAHKTLLQVNKDLAENTRLLMEEVARLRQELNGLKLSLENWRSEQEERIENLQRTSIPPFRPAAKKRGTAPYSDSQR